MALSGLEIFKLLPKTNCRDCGRPTCLAFAMQLAQKKANLSDCPHVSEEAKAALDEASAPPIRGVTIGVGERAIKIGEETVLFRHDEKFYNPAGVAVRVPDTLAPDELRERYKRIAALRFVRVGMDIELEGAAIENSSADAEKFKQAAEIAANETDLLLVLISDSPGNMAAALKASANKRPLIHAADKDNWKEMAALAKTEKCPLVARASTLEELADLTEQIKGEGVEDLVLDFATTDPKQLLTNLTISRRAALKRTFRPFGYPPIIFTGADDPFEEAARACMFMAKYAGLIVVNSDEPWTILPLLTTRQNIYTDPQKPIQVEPKVYTVGEPNSKSPVLFTTNFSLTYYTVEGDVEASRVPAYILVVDTEGTSVLTAYSGDKLSEKTVAKAMQDNKLEEIVEHKKIIIPGFVAVMSGKLEEASGWQVLVGPRESSAIPTYLKTVWPKEIGAA